MVILCVFLFVYSPALCARKAAKEQMFNKHFVALRLSVWPKG